MSSTAESDHLVATRRTSLRERPGLGEWQLALLGSVAFTVCALPLAVSGASGTAFHPFLAVALICCYAGATLVPFEVGAGVTDASMLVLVPMLFALPAEIVPLCCVAGLVIGRAADYGAGRIHVSRAVFCLGNSLHTVGPAAIIATCVDGGPRWTDAGWYALALASYLVVDALYAVAGEALADGARPRLQLRVLLVVYRLDVLLAPLGLLAAMATARADDAFLLAAPLLVVLGREARERAARIDGALALSESRSALLESELEAARAREDVLATVSHGLQLPVGTIVGLASLLHERGDEIDANRRIQACAHLYSEAVELRQLVRMSLDFVALRSGQALRVEMGAVDVDRAAAELRHVAVAVPGLSVRADTARLRQVLLALRELSCARGGDGVQVGRADDGTIELRAVVPSGSSALEPEREAADYEVAAALCDAMGGELTRTRCAGGEELRAILACAG